MFFWGDWGDKQEKSGFHALSERYGRGNKGGIYHPEITPRKTEKSHMYAVLKQLSPRSSVFAGRQSFDVKRYLFMPEITFPMMKSTADKHTKIRTKELINITPSLNK